jgi:hypothetical protein
MNRLVVRIKNVLRGNQMLYSIIQKIYHLGYISLKILGVNFRYYFIHPDKNLIYLSNFKVASSSILAVLMNKDAIDHDTIHTEARQVLNEKTFLSNEEKGYYKFTFVRNPYTRLISCYNNKVLQERSKPIPYFKQNMFGKLASVADFDEFVMKVCKIPDRISDVHFVSQSHFIYSKGHPVVDYIGKMESLDTDFESVRSAFSLKSLPHYNKTKRTNWMDSYSHETAQMVYKRYFNDFHTFDYVEEYKNLIQYLGDKDSV